MTKRQYYYYKRKEEIREEAVLWQYDFSENKYSCGELAFWGNYFYELGKRYGLLKEFRENAIC